MRVALWLASRELAARPGRVALAAGAVAAATALAVGLDLVARLRQGAVAERIDRAGPPLRVVPAGVSATALARYDLGGRLLPAGAAEAVRRNVPGLRALEARLVLEAAVAGQAAPLVGVPGPGAAWDGALAALRPGEVALGAVLAEKSGARAGEEIPVGRARFRVAAVLPAAASAEDLAAYLPLAALQDLAWLPGAVNELRLFLRPGFRPDEAAALVALPPGAALVRTGRGEVAEREAPQALDRLRRLGSGVAGAVAALALLLAAHLDAAERRGELAALVALGGTGATVLASVLARSSLTAAAGAAAGAIAGAAAAWLQDPARAWAIGDALPRRRCSTGRRGVPGCGRSSARGGPCGTAGPGDRPRMKPGLGIRATPRRGPPAETTKETNPMTLTLTCMLCLAGAASPAAPAPGEAGDDALTLWLASAPAPPPDVRLADLGPASALAQHDHGPQGERGEGDSEGHGGHGAWMGTAMIVVMVAMMVGLGAVMMARGGFRAAPPSGPAAAALPAFAPAGFSAPGG